MKKMRKILFGFMALFLFGGIVYADEPLQFGEGEVPYREIKAVKRKTTGWDTYVTDVIATDNGFITVGFDCPIVPETPSPGKGDVKALSMTDCTGFFNVYDKDGNSVDGVDLVTENSDSFILGVTETTNGYVALTAGVSVVDGQVQQGTFIIESDKELNQVKTVKLHDEIFTDVPLNHIVSYGNKVVVSLDGYVFVYDSASDKTEVLLDDVTYPAVAIDKDYIYVAGIGEHDHTYIEKYNHSLEKVASEKLYSRDVTNAKDYGIPLNLSFVDGKIVASLNGGMTNLGDAVVSPGFANVLVVCDKNLKVLDYIISDYVIFDMVDSRGDIAFVGFKQTTTGDGGAPIVNLKEEKFSFDLPVVREDSANGVTVRGKYNFAGKVRWSVDYASGIEAFRIDKTSNGVIIGGYDMNDTTGYTYVYEYELFDVATKTDGNGTIEVNRVEGTEGELVEFTITPKEGYVLKKVVVTNEFGQTIEFTENKFTLPSADVEIYAEFEKVTVPNPSTGLNNPYVSLGLIAAMATGAIIILKKKKYI